MPNKIDRAVSTIFPNLPHHPSDPVTVVRIVFGIEHHSEVGQCEQTVAFGDIKTHPLMHYRVQIFRYTGMSLLFRTVGNFVRWKNRNRLRPGFTVFRGL
ncbi:hypothetical protein D3C87_1568030 [compost metagenome]